MANTVRKWTNHELNILADHGPTEASAMLSGRTVNDCVQARRRHGAGLAVSPASTQTIERRSRFVSKRTREGYDVTDAIAHSLEVFP